MATLKKQFLNAAKEMGVSITSFKALRTHEAAMVYQITTNLSKRVYDYGYFIGEPDSEKERMITDFKSDVTSLINKHSV